MANTIALIRKTQAMKLADRTRTVLLGLRAAAEGENEDGWKQVYLDNVSRPGVTPLQFRGCLAALADAGLYRVVDGYAWGSVKMDAHLVC